MNWHQKEITQVLGELNTTTEGLTRDEVKRRLEKYGLNELIKIKRRTTLGMFVDQFRDFMILVLIAAAIISGFVGDFKDTTAIVFVVILNAAVGFFQEYQAEKAIEALKTMAALKATVFREGAKATVAAAGIVPGDIVILEAGSIVPADLRLIETAALTVEEASLTGESVPVEKSAEVIEDENIALGDMKNMAFSSTVVTHGRGLGVAVTTGMDTQIGRIASLLEKQEEVKTPLQRRMADFGQKLAIAILAVCLIVFIVGVGRGEPVVLMFLTAISLAVAAIPEALPAVVTISLALGARNMVERHVLIRRLPAVETLGSVTYICSDKTGTLTQNVMSAEEVFVDGLRLSLNVEGFKSEEGKTISLEAHPHLMLFLRGIALCNDATIPEAEVKFPAGGVFGDPTEVALLVLAARAGIHKTGLKESYPRVSELPFDSERKRMTTIHQTPEGGYISFTKGALEVFLESMTYYQGPSAVTPMTPQNRDKIAAIAESMAASGLRVLALGFKSYERFPDLRETEKEVVFLGLVGLLDPPREEAREAVSLCKTAGIRPVMITGDHPETARVIASRLGIIDETGEMVSGAELSAMPLATLEERVRDIGVYARVSPEHKIKIVKALQDKGEIVAMTGDGVNDAPALKAADIGVAMGIIGTDVARETSDMVLTDDNFASIVAAVREGRKIYDNIRKVVKFLLASNSAEILTLFLAPFLGLPLPLTPLQILWINLLTDSFPALALTVEPEERGVMQRPPRDPQESLFARGTGIYIFWVGLLMSSVSLGVMHWAYFMGDAHWQTMVFTVLCVSQLGHVLAIRVERESFFSVGALTNKLLLGSVIGMLGLQLVVVYVPVLQPVFRTNALGIGELMVCLALSSVVFFAVEIEKWWRRAS